MESMEEFLSLIESVENALCCACPLDKVEMIRELSALVDRHSVVAMDAVLSPRSLEVLEKMMCEAPPI